MTSGPVGYLSLHRPPHPGYEGERGSHFDYVMAKNGVFVEAEGKFMAARALVSRVAIRGLSPTWPKLALRHGLIPRHLFQLALDAMLADWTRELFVAIIWDGPWDGPGMYQIHIPEQERRGAGVKYDRHPCTVLDLHSHGDMEAVFSDTDDADEVDLGVYGVVGTYRGVMPALSLRVGVYGYFYPVDWSEVFTGTCPVLDVVANSTHETATILAALK